ncbi:MAG: hypothetical protein AAEI92_03890, partial [Arenicellales bacterium]
MNLEKQYVHFNHSPISGALGAVVTGIDLSEDLGPLVVAEIRSAINEYLVLLFRDQNLTLSAHRKFAEH